MKLGKKEIKERFTIPSGIVTTEVSTLEKIAREVPEIGILTTKSIGPEPREGNREPIFAEYAPGSYANAVGLTNPGAEEFARRLKNIKIPKDKFLLTSIFGANLEEFIYVAETLAPLSDGLELNLSCPHAKGYGQQIGENSKLVQEIITTLTNRINIPIFAKLSPNILNIREMAELCVDSGAYGIVAINTVGPGYFMVDGYPILTNQVGGLSGKGILPIGLKCIKEISEALKTSGKKAKIIACGGINDAQDVKNYEVVGADFFGVGSALKGMNTEELKLYFKTLKNDLIEGTNNASKFLKYDTSMKYREIKIKRKTDLANDLTLIEFDRSFDANSGQYIFLWVPLIGEKPFSVLDNDPFTVLIQKKGYFTNSFLNMKENDILYVRGPHGKKIETSNEKNENNLILVGGGTGIAALYLIAKENKDKKINSFLGAKDKSHLAYINKFDELGNVFVSTEDGSEGFKGNVVELLKYELKKENNFIFYNCGPEKMIEAALKLEEEYVNKDRIFYSIDNITRCGVGICGSCATSDGRRSCVDGPFLKYENSKI